MSVTHSAASYSIKILSSGNVREEDIFHCCFKVNVVCFRNHFTILLSLNVTRNASSGVFFKTFLQVSPLRECSIDHKERIKKGAFKSLGSSSKDRRAELRGKKNLQLIAIDQVLLEQSGYEWLPENEIECKCI